MEYQICQPCIHAQTAGYAACAYHSQPPSAEQPEPKSENLKIRHIVGAVILGVLVLPSVIGVAGIASQSSPPAESRPEQDNRRPTSAQPAKTEPAQEPIDHSLIQEIKDLNARMEQTLDSTDAAVAACSADEIWASVDKIRKITAEMEALSPKLVAMNEATRASAKKELPKMERLQQRFATLHQQSENPDQTLAHCF